MSKSLIKGTYQLSGIKLSKAYFLVLMFSISLGFGLICPAASSRMSACTSKHIAALQNCSTVGTCKSSIDTKHVLKPNSKLKLINDYFVWFYLVGGL